jgi:hypothetical protein
LLRTIAAARKIAEMTTKTDTYIDGRSVPTRPPSPVLGGRTPEGRAAPEAVGTAVGGATVAGTDVGLGAGVAVLVGVGGIVAVTNSTAPTGGPDLGVGGAAAGVQVEISIVVLFGPGKWR